ncbi:MAG: subclass B3 metallo-beta-lactamase [Gammaproteobacteria bacterium]|nr:subclass B3 metallo-beta-lactamase [Gammaproteobacteria bacterium]
MALAVLTAAANVNGEPAAPCKDCAAWNETQKPFRIYGNTYYVGVRGLSSILITSNGGHVIIDGGLAESAPKIAASVRELGFRMEDVKLILNSHVHYDHAGGIAELQRLSGAQVAASPSSAKVLRAGHSGADDPQFGGLRGIPPVAHVTVVNDGETLRVGPLQLTAHLTAGHTPGGTTWTWTSCEKERCLNLVYADSLQPVSAEGFLFTRNSAYPDALEDFERSFRTLDALPCDILLTPHPETSDLWRKLKNRDDGAGPGAFVDPTACHRLADAARERLRERVVAERRG